LHLTPCERDDFSYRLVDVDPVFLRRSFLGKRPNSLDDFSGSMRVVSALQSSMLPATHTAPLASPGEIRVPLRLSSVRDDGGKRLALAAG